MYSVVADLLVLQERDQRLMRLKADLARMPKDREALDRREAEARAAHEARREGVKRAETDRRKLELEVEAKQQLIARYKGQQMQTRKNEEYSALMHEIEREETAIQALEDRELDLMEVVERETAAAKDEEAKLAAALSEIAKARETLAQRQAAAEAEVANAETQRAEAEAKVEPNALRLYQRILNSKKDAAVVRLEHGSCGGCHMKLTTQTVNRAERAPEIVQCDNCGRILYAD